MPVDHPKLPDPAQSRVNAETNEDVGPYCMFRGAGFATLLEG